MFTGIVTHLGRVASARMRGGLLELDIASSEIARELHNGDSVAVNGVCLTATRTSRRRFGAEVMGETLVRSTFGNLRKGMPVNLELPARLNDRLGGHLVQGHVDGVASVVRVEDGDGSRRLWFHAADEVLRYLVPKGSVALDGVSLTIVEVGRTSFQVAIIPHTLAETTFTGLEVGSTVNVEVDVLSKYVERLLTHAEKE
ncbi:MAG: riboflavin synthase [Actinomycetota bacterium]|nr:riboflavin synthase [Actinomycetota bacterium]